MPNYYNPWPHAVELVGPNGERTKILSKSTRELSDFYDKYLSKGYILKAEAGPQISTKQPQNPVVSVKQRIFDGKRSTEHIKPTVQNVKVVVQNNKKLIQKKQPNTTIIGQLPDRQVRLNKPGLGAVINVDAKKIYDNSTSYAPYRISNGVCVCVLSYNRGKSLLRLIESIRKTTDLNKVVVFISDDCSTDQYTIDVLSDLEKDPKLVVIRNKTNIGVAGNTNRLLRCAERFQHIFLLNDDVELLNGGWEEYFIENSAKAGLCHVCYRQNGVYNAKEDEATPLELNGISLNVVYEKPHGAFLYITNQAFKTCGYFDEQFGLYGFEHIDWSLKPYEFGLQPPGFFDFIESNKFVMIHDEKSAIKNKHIEYKKSMTNFKSRLPGCKALPSERSVVPSISYVVPCRNFERSDSIKTVVNGIIGQSFPHIQIILVEQDVTQKLKLSDFKLIDKLVFVNDSYDGLFNKSKAFNVGVTLCKYDVILHDADMISRADYTKRIYDLLLEREAVHICGAVIYLDKESTHNVNVSGVLPVKPSFERVVGYFEGGSLALRRSSYWDIGGFNEDFWGYGVEDCDFYARASSLSTWLRSKEYDLVHLWHSRVPNWQTHHQENINLGKELAKMSIQDRINQQKSKLLKSGYIK